MEKRKKGFMDFFVYLSLFSFIFLFVSLTLPHLILSEELIIKGRPQESEEVLTDQLINKLSFLVNMGTVKREGKDYYQLGLRPAFRIGKVRAGLDVLFFMDSGWNVYRKRVEEIGLNFFEINLPTTFFRFGTLGNITYGRGLLVNNYYSSTADHFNTITGKGAITNYKSQDFTFSFFGTHSETYGLNFNYTLPSNKKLTIGSTFVFVDKAEKIYKGNFSAIAPSINYELLPAKLDIFGEWAFWENGAHGLSIGGRYSLSKRSNFSIEFRKVRDDFIPGFLSSNFEDLKASGFKDGIDNDGDSIKNNNINVDENTESIINGKDDDGDGLIDEEVSFITENKNGYLLSYNFNPIQNFNFRVSYEKYSKNKPHLLFKSVFKLFDRIDFSVMTERDIIPKSDFLGDGWTVRYISVVKLTNKINLIASYKRSYETDGKVNSNTEVKFQYNLFSKPEEKIEQIFRESLESRTVLPTSSKIIYDAERFLGTPYVRGGETPAGFDCSGFTQYVFKLNNINIPRTAEEQYLQGKIVSYSDIRPGDLVFFKSPTPSDLHVGIYKGDRKFIHSSSKSGVIVSSLDEEYYSKRFAGIRRY